MSAFSASLSRVAKSAKKKLHSSLSSEAGSSHSEISDVNDSELPSTSTSGTLQSQDESKESPGLEAMSGHAGTFQPLDASEELNVPAGPTTTSESAESASPRMSKISTSDGQQDDELSNENTFPASENRKDVEPPTSNHNTGHIDANHNDKISKPAPDIQEIKRPVAPPPPVSGFADVKSENGPLTTLPPPLPANAWTINSPPSSSGAFGHRTSAVDAPPIPSFQLSPPTPTSAGPTREDPLRRTPSRPSVPAHSSHSEDEAVGKKRTRRRDRSSTTIPASTSTASANTSADTAASSSSTNHPAPKTVEFAGPSSYRNEVHEYHQSSPPKSVGEDLADQRPEMPFSPSGSRANNQGILKQSAEQKQADTNQPEPIENAPKPTKVYVVIKDTATTKDAGPWDQVLHKIEGVYLSEQDANNKVVQMHNDRVTDIAVDISLSQKGYGSRFYKWETNRRLKGGWLYRVHVQEYDLTPASNEKELKPINKVRSMLNV